MQKRSFIREFFHLFFPLFIDFVLYRFMIIFDTNQITVYLFYIHCPAAFGGYKPASIMFYSWLLRSTQPCICLRSLNLILVWARVDGDIICDG